MKGFGMGSAGALLAPKVVITMPAYKAEATLARTVADIPPGVADQLILVDDASPDNTAELARELGIDVHVHPENRGYGANQKTCYKMALADDADIVVMLHPDYQYEPKAVPLLIAPILAGDADMTFGSRFAGLGDPRTGGMPLYRYLGNRVTTIAENLLLGSRFTEMHSGMRAYTRQCLLSLPFLRYSGDFAFDSEFLIDAVTGGQRVIEVPIPTRYTDESSSIGTLRSLSYVARSLGYCAKRVASHGRKTRSPIGRRNTRGVEPPRGVPLGDRPCVLCGVARAHFQLPVPDRVRCGTCGLLTFVEAELSTQPPARGGLALDLSNAAGRTCDWVLEELAGYVLQGGHILETAESRTVLHDRGADGRLRQLPVWPASVLDSNVNAILLTEPSAAILSALGGIAGLRKLLAPEGMLAVVLPDSGSRAASAGAWPEGVAPQTLERALRDGGFGLVEMRGMPRQLAREHTKQLDTLRGARAGSATMSFSLVLARAVSREREGS